MLIQIRPFTLFCSILLICCFIFPISTIILKDGGRYQLPLILTLLVMLLVFSQVVMCYQNKTIHIQIDKGLYIYILSIITMTYLLVVKSSFEGQFNGRFVDIDYGFKGNTTEKSIGFVPEFNTVGHCLWGVIPIICLFSWFKSLKIWQLVLKEFISSGIVVYPIYNIIKRSIHSWDDFAWSSFYNNGSEWLYGTYFGISISFVIMSIWKQQYEYKFNIYCVWYRIIMSSILFITIFWAYIVTLMTWNAHNNQPIWKPITALSFVIPLLLLIHYLKNRFIILKNIILL